LLTPAIRAGVVPRERLQGTVSRRRPRIRLQNETAIYLTGNGRFELSHACLARLGKTKSVQTRQWRVDVKELLNMTKTYVFITFLGITLHVMQSASPL